MPHSNDLEIAQRVLAGEREAFDTLFDHFYEPILAYAVRELGSGRRALAVTEASLEALLARLDGYRGEMPLAVLAFGIVRGITKLAARSLATAEPAGRSAHVGARA